MLLQLLRPMLRLKYCYTSLGTARSNRVGLALTTVTHPLALCDLDRLRIKTSTSPHYTLYTCLCGEPEWSIPFPFAFAWLASCTCFARWFRDGKFVQKLRSAKEHKIESLVSKEGLCSSFLCWILLIQYPILKYNCLTLWSTYELDASINSIFETTKPQFNGPLA